MVNDVFSDRYVERPGYVFKGWYTQKQGGKKVTSKTVIKGNTDVYAQWEPGKFSLDAKQIFVNIGNGKSITASVTSEQNFLMFHVLGMEGRRIDRLYMSMEA
ncbi:MAG: InlB B-repeat-containing protein [Frisingicoccus sp.]